MKKWSFTINSSLNEGNNTLVILIRNYRKRKFMKILTEGLCSYGFSVINLKVKIKNISKKAEIKNIFINEWNFIISTTIDFCKKSKTTLKPNYFVINLSKSLTSFQAILLDDKIKCVILVNPKLNKQTLKNYNSAVEQIGSKLQVYNIFSKYSISLLKNYSLLRFLRKIYPRYTDILKYSTILKAKKSFKNYETIVLSILIDAIENKLYNPKENT